MLKKLLIILVFVVLNSFLFAQDKSEFGLGATYFSTPAYIGSSKQKNYILPFPYIEYYGKYFNIDRDKVYNELLDTNKVKLEISLSGMLPVESKDTARKNMPDLDAILEFGPKLIYNIKEGKDRKLDIQLPIRAAFSVGDNLFEYEGFYSSLDFSFEDKIFDDFKIVFTTGISYTNERLNNYYYEVDSKYTTSNRREYHSQGGYSGYHNSIAITKKDDKYWYGAFIKHFNINNAVFENSPLIEKKNSFYYGIAFSYLFNNK